MNSSNQIEKELKSDLLKISKIVMEEWKEKALNKTDYLETALKIGLANEKPYCWRCSWIISRVTAINKLLVKPYINQIIRSLDSLKYDSQISGFLRTLILSGNIEEDQIGILADYCIKIIFDTQRPSHNKYYAIQLLIGIAKKIPDLSREFSLVIDTNLPYFEKPYLRKFGKEASVKLNNKVI